MAEVTPCDFQDSVMRNLVASAYTNRYILSWNSLSLEETSDCVRTATNHETTCRGRERERGMLARLQLFQPPQPSTEPESRSHLGLSTPIRCPKEKKRGSRHTAPGEISQPFLTIYSTPAEVSDFMEQRQAFPLCPTHIPDSPNHEHNKKSLLFYATNFQDGLLCNKR